MQLGVVFPQNEIGEDPGAVRAFAEAAEGLGYAHLVFYDHVLGADTNRRPDWQGPYSHEDTFHEPLVTFGYLAALTSRIELVSGIIILPQRQTVLVAKQAAQVDVLSGGRLRLGVGIGWNDVEYEGLPGSELPRPGQALRGAGRNCCARSGPTRLSTSRADGTASPARASSRCRCSVPSPCGLVRRRTLGRRSRVASPVSATGGSRSCRRTSRAGSGWSAEALQGSGRRGGTLAGRGRRRRACRPVPRRR